LPSTTADILANAVIALVASGLGAFAGAYFAFRNERKSKADAELRRQIDVGKKTQFIIVQQINALAVVQQSLLDPIRDRGEYAWLSLRSASIGEHEDLRHELSDLGFLIDPRGVDMLMKISIAEDNFRAAVDAVNKWANFSKDVYQPTLEKAQILDHHATQASLSLEQVQQALGGRIFGLGRSLGNDVFKHVDGALDALKESFDLLEKQLRERFPGENFLKLKESKKIEKTVYDDLD
jgi:hypothetical protein